MKAAKNRHLQTGSSFPKESMGRPYIYLHDFIDIYIYIYIFFSLIYIYIYMVNACEQSSKTFWSSIFLIGPKGSLYWLITISTEVGNIILRIKQATRVLNTAQANTPAPWIFGFAGFKRNNNNSRRQTWLSIAVCDSWHSYCFLLVVQLAMQFALLRRLTTYFCP